MAKPEDQDPLARLADDILDAKRRYDRTDQPEVLVLGLSGGNVVIWRYQGDVWALGSALLAKDAPVKDQRVIKVTVVMPGRQARGFPVTLGPANRQGFDLKAAFLEANPA